jgi:hypothetical protein
MNDQDWPRDLPEYVFVLRGLERLKESGISRDSAREEISSWLLEQKDRLAVIQSMVGAVVGRLQPEVWSSQESCDRIFLSGTWQSRRIPGPRTIETIRRGGMGWIQIPKTCVSTILKAKAGRETRSVTRPAIKEFQDWFERQRAEWGHPPTLDEKLRWAAEHKISRDEARAKLLPTVEARQPGEHARTLARKKSGR